MANNTFVHYPSIQTEMIWLVVMLSIFAVVGSIGNTLATCVFYKVREKSTAQIFILTMSIMDLFTCTVIIPFTIVVEYLRYDIRYDALCKLYHFLITFKVPLSAFLMVAIAFDRYFCICHPLRRIVTPFRMKIVIIVLTTFACCLGIITSLGYGVYLIANMPSSPMSDFPNYLSLDGIGSKLMDWHPVVDVPQPSDDISDVFFNSFLEFLHNRNQSNAVDELLNSDKLVYIGICRPNNLILDLQFLYVYQRLYSVIFVVCLVMVAVLYIMIYRFIQIRRSKKLQQKLMLCSYMNGEHAFEGTRLTLLNGGDEEQVKEDRESVNVEQPALDNDQNKNTDFRRRSSFYYNAEKLREETRTANIKTAIMLFMVTAVFIVAFLPAWLMAHAIIPTNIVIFYMYFSYNVINPCIYAFMNPVFQENLRKIFRRRFYLYNE